MGKKVSMTSALRRLHESGLLNTDLFDIIASKDYNIMEIVLREGLTTDINEERENAIMGIVHDYDELIIPNWLFKKYGFRGSYFNVISPLAFAMLVGDERAIRILKKFGAQYTLLTENYYLCNKRRSISCEELLKGLALAENERKNFFDKLIEEKFSHDVDDEQEECYTLRERSDD